MRAAQRIGELSQELAISAGGANPAATLPAGGKSKHDELEEAGLSTSVAYRYEELAGPPEIHDAIRSETERYLNACKTEKTPATIEGLRAIARHAVKDKLGSPPEVRDAVIAALKGGVRDLVNCR